MINNGISMKKNYFWNTIAMIISSLSSAMLVYISSFTVSENEVGYVTFAFSLSSLLLIVGKFGGRDFQMSSIYERVLNDSGLIIRYLFTFIMFILALVYCYATSCIREKFFIILFTLFIYMSESIEDFFWGKYQKKGKIYIGAIMYSIRWIMVIIVFFCFITLYEDACIALGFGAIISWIALFVSVMVIKESFVVKIPKAFLENDAKIIFSACFPICLSYFCSYYISIVTKIYIDIKMDDVIQAYFGYIFLFSSCVPVLGTIVFHPQLSVLANEHNNNIDGFSKKLWKIGLGILGVGFFFSFVVSIIGIPILNFLFSCNLSDYKGVLVILLVYGVVLALSTFAGSVEVILAKQKSLLAVNVFGAILISILDFGGFVKGSLLNMTIVLVSVQIVILLFQVLIIKRCIYEEKNENQF